MVRIAGGSQANAHAAGNARTKSRQLLEQAKRAEEVFIEKGEKAAIRFLSHEMTAKEITKLDVFEGREIRKTIHNDEWWFSVADVVETLTDSIDTRQYIKRMRRRDHELDSYWGTICTPLELLAPDGKIRKTNCSNTEGLFRIIQSIPSPKAEPFKRWLAKVGHARVQEIENPELAMARMQEL